MRSFLTVAALLSAGLCHAQVFKCTGPDGRTIYSQTACPAGGGALLDARRPSSPAEQYRKSEGYRLGSEQAAPAVRPPVQEPSSAQVIGAQPRCPSEQDVRNLQVSASGVHLEPIDREVLLEQVRRARACQPLMDDGQMQSMRAELRRKLLTSLPPAQAAPRGPLTCMNIGGGMATCN